MDSRSDEQLMADYQAGDYEAFLALYDRSAPRVYGYLRRRVRDSAQVEELFQSIFMKLHQTRHRYDTEFKFQPWLFTLCRCTLVDSLRRNRVLGTFQTEPLDESTLACEAAPTPPGLELSALSGSQQEVVRMRFEEDLSFEEMGRRLGIQPQAVRQRLSRAIRSLRNFLRTSEA